MGSGLSINEIYIDLVAEFYRYVDDKYRDYIQIYTDGSKDPESGMTGVNQGGKQTNHE